MLARRAKKKAEGLVRSQGRRGDNLLDDMRARESLICSPSCSVNNPSSDVDNLSFGMGSPSLRSLSSYRRMLSSYRVISSPLRQR